MKNLDLEQPGNKKINIKGRELTIKWLVKSKNRIPTKTEVSYEGLITIYYKKDGEKKSKSISSSSTDKNQTWNSLIQKIDNFLEKIEEH